MIFFSITSSRVVVLIPHRQRLWHFTPTHYEDRESDKYEEGATDADHRKCPKVDLTIAWEVVSADLLRKKLVVLLHLLASKMAKSFVLTDVTIFCPSRCHNFLSSGCPQEGFGARLSHSSLNQIVGLSRHSIFTVWHRSVPNQLGNWKKNTLSSLRQISAPNKSSWHDHCQCWFTALSKDFLQNIGMKLRGWDHDPPPGLEKYHPSVYLWLHYTKSHHKAWMHN